MLRKTIVCVRVFIYIFIYLNSFVFTHLYILLVTCHKQDWLYIESVAITQVLFAMPRYLNYFNLIFDWILYHPFNCSIHLLYLFISPILKWIISDICLNYDVMAHDNYFMFILIYWCFSWKGITKNLVNWWENYMLLVSKTKMSDVVCNTILSPDDMLNFMSL